MSEHNYDKLAEAIEKLSDVIYDIRDRVTRIEEGQKRQAEIERKAEYADDKATEALLLAKQNSKDIDSQRVVNRWIWGIVFAVIIGIGGALAKVLVS